MRRGTTTLGAGRRQLPLLPRNCQTQPDAQVPVTEGFVFWAGAPAQTAAAHYRVVRAGFDAVPLQPVRRSGGGLVPGIDPLTDVGVERFHGTVLAAFQQLRRQFGEPAFDEIYPAAGGRGEMQHEPGVVREPAPDRWRFVAGGVVQDELHAELRGDGLLDRFEELQELDRAVALVQRAQHLPGLDFSAAIDSLSDQVVSFVMSNQGGLWCRPSETGVPEGRAALDEAARVADSIAA
jgi:hypothetical protein